VNGVPADFTGDPASIDASLRQICAALQERDLVIGDLAERFWKADGWRRLNYATDAQYACERLAPSFILAKTSAPRDFWPARCDVTE
jgi:hypothetical protein